MYLSFTQSSIHSDQLFVAYRKTCKHRCLSAIQSSHCVLFEQVKPLPLLGSVLFFYCEQPKLQRRVCVSPAAHAVSLNQATILMRSDKISPSSSAGARFFSPQGRNACFCAGKRKEEKKHGDRIAVEGCEDGRLPKSTDACEKPSLGIF